MFTGNPKDMGRLAYVLVVLAVACTARATENYEHNNYITHGSPPGDIELCTTFLDVMRVSSGALVADIGIMSTVNSTNAHILDYVTDMLVLAKKYVAGVLQLSQLCAEDGD